MEDMTSAASSSQRTPATPPAKPAPKSTAPALRTASQRGIHPEVLPDGVVKGVANILCDGTGRLGALSYCVPDDMVVRLGDAVHVPFGTREVHGVVLGEGDPKKATRDVIRVYGKRVSSAEIMLAQEISRRHFCDIVQVATRLSPRSGRGHDPLQAGELVLAPSETPIYYPRTADSRTRRYLLRAPLVDPVRLAAEEAYRLASVSDTAQVLVLCPTVEILEGVLAHLPSGAARLDTKAAPGAWRGLCDGGVKVAVGTRAAAMYSAADLAGVVVVEEDHPGHLEATQPYTHARDVASGRTLAMGVPLVVIGANPTPSALGAKLKVISVGTKSDWPRFRLVERQDFRPTERLVPPPLAAALERARKEGVTPLVLAERSKATRRCVRCGAERLCAECTSSLCRHQETLPCARCKTVDVRMSGWDTKRLGSLLGRHVKPLQLKALSGATDAGLVVLFDIDPALNAPGLSPESVAAHLLIVAAQAAGRGGQVVVMTSQSDHPLLQDLCVRRDQLTMAKRSWETAQQSGLPPFGRLVTVRTGQERSPRTTTWPGTIYGPRRVGSEWEVLVQVSDADLPRLGAPLERLRRGGKVRITVS